VFVVRNDLVSQIRTASDLRGRTIGLTARGVAPEFDLAKLLEQSGLALSDVNDGQENLDSIQMYQSFFLSSDLQQMPIDATNLIDTYFVEAALRSVGPYQP
jgi:ABC-type nitrate/sulfonate/bicarbonate transport system substrate-binding protein